MWIQKRIDISWRDLTAAILFPLFPSNPDKIQKKIKKLWPIPANTYSFLSIRSGFDLALNSLEFPPGSKVLMTALTVPDMATIIRRHGLIPHPIDINISTMAPLTEDIERAVTPDTKAIVVAHLFGSRIDMAPVIDIAKKYGLIVIEDMAQSFTSTSECGHPDSDICMFSFGSIKTSTALGGACFIIKQAELLEKMLKIHKRYPTQSTPKYLKKVIKYSFLKLMQNRIIFYIAYNTFRIFSVDYDSRIYSLVRGFSGNDLFTEIRQTPNATLLRLMYRRLRQDRGKDIALRKKKGDLLKRHIEKKHICPGIEKQDNYWVFPVMADNPSKFKNGFLKHGFDASQRQGMRVIPVHDNSQAADPKNASRIYNQMFYVPFYPEIPDRDILKIARLINELV